MDNNIRAFPLKEDIYVKFFVCDGEYHKYRELDPVRGCTVIVEQCLCCGGLKSTYQKGGQCGDITLLEGKCPVSLDNKHVMQVSEVVENATLQILECEECKYRSIAWTRS